MILEKQLLSHPYKFFASLVMANRAQIKLENLYSLLTEIEVQWVNLRLLFDLRGITEGEFKLLSARLAEIEKQTRAWLNWQRNNTVRNKGQTQNRKTSWTNEEIELM